MQKGDGVEPQGAEKLLYRMYITACTITNYEHRTPMYLAMSGS